MKKFILIILFQLTIISKAFVIPDSSADPIIVKNVAFIKLGTYSKKTVVIYHSDSFDSQYIAYRRIH